jgi:hypothetical protein
MFFISDWQTPKIKIKLFLQNIGTLSQTQQVLPNLVSIEDRMGSNGFEYML